jgi:hypothetical protein
MIVQLPVYDFASVIHFKSGGNKQILDQLKS